MKKRREEERKECKEAWNKGIPSQSERRIERGCRGKEKIEEDRERGHGVKRKGGRNGDGKKSKEEKTEVGGIKEK